MLKAARSDFFRSASVVGVKPRGEKLRHAASFYLDKNGILNYTETKSGGNDMDLKKQSKKTKLYFLTAALIFLAVAAVFTVLTVMNIAGFYLLFVVFCVLFYGAFLITIALILGIKYIALTLNGHRVEVYLGGKTYLLVSDGVILDQYVSIAVMELRLEGMIDRKHVVVNVTAGLFAPSVSIFFDGVKQNIK